MNMPSKTGLGLIAALAGLAFAPVVSAHDRDWDDHGHNHGRGHGWGHHERHWDAYRPAPRPVVVRERIYAPPRPVIIEHAYYPQPAPVYYERPYYASRPAVTIGINIPPIVIPLR